MCQQKDYQYHYEKKKFIRLRSKISFLYTSMTASPSATVSFAPICDISHALGPLLLLAVVHEGHLSDSTPCPNTTNN